MSKIGKAPITIPQDVSLKLEGRALLVSGPKGQLSITLPKKIEAKIEEKKLLLERLSEDKQSKSNHGTFRSRIQGMVTGVTTGWQKELKVIGTGYRASVEGKTLSLVVGFIKPAKLLIPEGLTVLVDQDSKITISGIDKILVGQFASNVHKVKKPDVYQGKGVRYVDEYVKLKPGKAVKKDA